MRRAFARLRRGRAYVDDSARIAVRRQHPCEFARQVEGAVDVDRHDAGPPVILHIDQLVDYGGGRAAGGQFGVALCHSGVELRRAVVGRRTNAGIGDGDVEPAEGGAGGSYGVGDGGAVGDVAGKRQMLRRVSGRGDRVGSGFGIEIERGDARAVRRQPFDDGAADATAGTGDDRSTAFKPAHSLAPVRSRAAT